MSLVLLATNIIAKKSQKSGNELNLHLLSRKTYDKAVCNDGTMAAFYLRKGSASKRWIIYLQGGGACYTKKSCGNRETYRSSSKIYPPTIGQKEGLFNTNCKINPYWCDANMVFVPYCTSDFWTGDKKASSKTYNFHFRGSRVVTGVIDTLIQKHGLDTQSKEILWSGCSAGGKGALYNMDRVQERLPHMKALLDSNWWVDFPAMREDIRDFESMTKKAYYRWNAKLIPECIADHKKNPWMCIFPNVNEKYTKTPHLNQVFQYDYIQMNKNTGNGFKKKTTEALKYGEKLRKAIVKSFKNVNKKNGAMFSPACYKHCSTAEDVMFKTKVNGKTFAQTLTKWFQGKMHKDERMNVGKCKGVNCNDKCDTVPLNPFNPMKELPKKKLRRKTIKRQKLCESKRI